MRGASWPVSTRPKNSKRASPRALLTYGAQAVMYREASHAFHVSIGVVRTIAANVLKNDGWERITFGVRSIPCGFAQASQSKPGTSAGRRAKATLLFVFAGFRLSTCVH